MDTNMDSIGIDGCPSGWLAVSLCDGDLHWALAGTIASLIQQLPSTGAIYIDIPIGLSSLTSRDCDIAARRYLGPARRSSIFPAPLRQLLSCSEYQQANALSRSIQDKGLSIQSWNIVPKIREVDTYLQQQTKLQRRLRESHPEVAFQALAGKPLCWPKKKPEGLKERLALLDRNHPAALSCYESIVSATKRGDVARDDIVDAMCLALMACGGRQLCTLPAKPSHDETGLPVEICYFA